MNKPVTNAVLEDNKVEVCTYCALRLFILIRTTHVQEKLPMPIGVCRLLAVYGSLPFFFHFLSYFYDFYLVFIFFLCLSFILFCLLVMSREIPGSSVLNYSLAGMILYCGEFVAGETAVASI